MKKEIKLNKTKGYCVGVRLTPELFAKVETISKQYKVSFSKVIHSVLENFIDECEFSN